MFQTHAHACPMQSYFRTRRRRGEATQLHHDLLLKRLTQLECLAMCCVAVSPPTAEFSQQLRQTLARSSPRETQEDVTASEEVTSRSRRRREEVPLNYLNMGISITGPFSLRSVSGLVGLGL